MFLPGVFLNTMVPRRHIHGAISDAFVRISPAHRTCCLFTFSSSGCKERPNNGDDEIGTAKSLLTLISVVFLPPLSLSPPSLSGVHLPSLPFFIFYFLQNLLSTKVCFFLNVKQIVDNYMKISKM